MKAQKRNGTGRVSDKLHCLQPVFACPSFVLRFWLPQEDFHNPTRKRVDGNIDISSLTRRVMKGTQLQRASARNPDSAS